MNAFNIIINFDKDININEKASSLIEDNCRIKFNNKILTQSFALFENENSHNVIVTPKQYSYRINGEFSVNNISNVADNILRSINSLADVIDGQNFSVRIVSINNHRDVFQATKKINVLANDSNDFLGVGYRYFFRYKNTLSEFKAEPLLTADDKLFYEAIYNAKNFNITVPLDDILLEIISDMEKKIAKFEKIL